MFTFPSSLSFPSALPLFRRWNSSQYIYACNYANIYASATNPLEPNISMLLTINRLRRRIDCR